MYPPSKDGSLAGAHVWSSSGVRATLGRERGRGGEGIVLEIGQGRLAKIHHPMPATARAAVRGKIEGMRRIAALRDDPRFAWPQAHLFADPSCLEWVGFSMRELSGVSLHALCSLTAVREHVPHWTRLHLTRVAYDLFDLAIRLAAHGVTIGDVSPGNFVVDRRTAEVSALDCDSFEVRVDGVVHLGSALTPAYSPPELLDAPTTRPRRRDQVVFACALLAYQVLTVGLHAYSREWGDDPVENLRSGRTVMGGSTGRATGWLHPALFSRYDGLHPAVKRACIRTFVDGHRSPELRPSLEAWRDALRTQFQHLHRARDAKGAFRV
jgi:DNA-binding helix-hairpin-helix protein with protein kinase domain